MTTSNTEPAPPVAQAQPSYKEQSIWRDVPMSQWRDWHWQMQHRIRSAEVDCVVNLTAGMGGDLMIDPNNRLVADTLEADWNDKLRVLAVGPRIQTWVNGKQVAEVADDEAYAKYPSGVIALQVHGVKRSPEKARHISFRSIRVRRIESAK